MTCLCLENSCQWPIECEWFFFCYFSSISSSYSFVRFTHSITREINKTTWNAVNWIRWAKMSVMYGTYTHTNIATIDEDFGVICWTQTHAHTTPVPSIIHWPRILSSIEISLCRSHRMSMHKHIYTNIALYTV